MTILSTSKWKSAFLLGLIVFAASISSVISTDQVKRSSENYKSDKIVTAISLKNHSEIANAWQRLNQVETLYFRDYEFKKAIVELSVLFHSIKDDSVRNAISQSLFNYCLFADSETLAEIKDILDYRESQIQFPLGYKTMSEYFFCFNAGRDAALGLRRPENLRWKFDTVANVEKIYDPTHIQVYLKQLKDRYELKSFDQVTETFLGVPLAQRHNEAKKFVEILKINIGNVNDLEFYFFLKYLIFKKVGIEHRREILEELVHTRASAQFETLFFNELESDLGLSSLPEQTEVQDFRQLRLNRLLARKADL
jgi:hypothetical protein